MKKIYLSIMLITVLFCKTTSESINPPIDYYDVIDEAVRVEPEVKQSNLKPESKLSIMKTTNALKECQEYSKQAYSKIIDNESKLSKCEENNIRYKNRIEALEHELWFYRLIKWSLISFIVIFTLYKLGIFQFIFALVKKAIFPMG